MEKKLLNDVLRKRLSVNPNLSSTSIVSTATTLNGYDTAIEGSNAESLYFSMDGTLQEDKIDDLSTSEQYLLTAKKKTTLEPNSPKADLEMPSMMLQSTPQILNKSRNIREEIPDLVFENNTLHFDEEKSTIVDVGKLGDIDEEKLSFKVLEKSVTLFRGEKENNDPVLELKSNLSENFDAIKLDDSARQMKRPPIPTPRSTMVLSPKNELKPTPSPRKMRVEGIQKYPALPSIVETSKIGDVVEKKNQLKDAIDKKPPTKSTRISISSRFRKSIIPSNQNEDSNIPLKRTRKSVAPPPTVVPSTRILRKSVAPTIRRSKSPAKKRQSIAVSAKPKTTTSSTELANKRRSSENLVKKRQSMAAKAKTPEKRRSIRSDNLKKRQSVALKLKTPEKRRSAGRKPVAPSFKAVAPLRQSIMPSLSRRSVMPMPVKEVPSQQQTPLTQAELTCDVCKKIFRLKSNLTAHKRLHASNASTNSSLKCSYCDKTFAIKTAYDNHLAQYCTKIPSHEKKKIMAAGAKSVDDSKNGSSVTNKSGFAPPAKPAAKPAMHSGIERTPSKTIDCRIDGCNRKFKDPIAYTEHSTHHHSMSGSSGDEK